MDEKSVGHKVARLRLREVEDFFLAEQLDGLDRIGELVTIGVEIAVQLAQGLCLGARRIEPDLALEQFARRAAHAKRIHLLDRIAAQSASTIREHALGPSTTTPVVPLRLDAESQEQHLSLAQ